MRLKNKKPSYVAFLAYLILFFLLLCFSCIDKSVAPYSIGIYSASLSIGANPFVVGLLYVLNFLILGKTKYLLSSLISCVVFICVWAIHKKRKALSPLSLSAFTLIALLGYLFLENTSSIEKLLPVYFLSAGLTFVYSVTLQAIFNKGLKYKFGYDEYLCLITTVAIFGVGLCNFTSPLVWKTVCAISILLACFLFKSGTGNVVSASLGISLAVYYGNISLISVFLIWGIVCGGLMPLNRYAASVCLPFTDVLVQVIFSVYNSYTLTDFLPVLIGSVVFCLIPTSPLNALKERLYSFRERQLVRQAINRNKTMLSNKLYELSGVFTEMKVAFNAFKKNQMSNEYAKELIVKQALSCVCEDCDKNKHCIKDKKLRKENLEKMVDIGFAKGKLTLIDMPKHLGERCARPSDLLYAVNKLLSDYRTYCLDKKNASIGRDLLAEEADGVAQMLKELALESGSLLSFHTKLERKLGDELLKNGFRISELLIYGDKENISVSMMLTMKEFPLNVLQRIISKVLGVQMILCDKNDVSESKTYLSFCRQAPFDAVFGIASATKDGSEKCGDTHSVIKISDDKFLVALSDGMGSGETAEKVSSIALSLIESFYRAGLPSELILKTVNKLLSINAEDTFTALDISVIDLKTCRADFIKYGSPYGFVIGENGIKIVEGNSLPLGILEELKPAVCQTNLANDNMLVLVTDGISDAFGSSGEIIDFIRTMPALNPQTLADSILKKAVELNDGKPKDDMTALAVRLFKKNVV